MVWPGTREKLTRWARVASSSCIFNGGTIKPGLLDLFTVVSHDAGVAGNMAWLERWRHELALVAVEIAFATEDTITNCGTKGTMNGDAFVEVIGMFDQNALDVLGFVEQDGRKRSKMHATDVALVCHTLQEAQTIFAKAGQVPDKRVPANVTKRFWRVYICLDLSCHDMFLANAPDT